jgi:hypothetical protein
MSPSHETDSLPAQKAISVQSAPHDLNRHSPSIEPRRRSRRASPAPANSARGGGQ